MKKRISFSLTLTSAERGFGWLYLAAEFLLLPPLIYTLGGLFGGFSDAAANFLYYLTNALCCGWIFRELLHQSLVQAGKQIPRLLGCTLVAFLGCRIAMELLNRLLGALMPEFYNVNDAAITAMVLAHPLMLGIGTILLVPIAEECLFRGLMFVPFYRRNRWLGYLVSALGFAAIHVVGYIGSYPPKILIVCFLQYLPAGIALCWACARTGTLFAPMLVHSAINAVSFLSLR